MSDPHCGQGNRCSSVPDGNGFCSWVFCIIRLLPLTQAFRAER